MLNIQTVKLRLNSKSPNLPKDPFVSKSIVRINPLQ